MTKTRPALDLEAISARFRVLSVPMRLAMLHALQRRELTVSELSEVLKSRVLRRQVLCEGDDGGGHDSVGDETA